MKLKEFFKRKMRKVGALCMSAMAMSAMAVSAFAAEGDTTAGSATVISAFTSGFQSIVSDAMSMIGAAAPIALSLAGVIFLTKKAMSWFKGIAK